MKADRNGDHRRRASGARAAHALRDNAWDGEITLLGNEGWPLMTGHALKSRAARSKTTAQCALYDETFYSGQRIDLRVDASVQQIDRAARKVVLKGRAYRRLSTSADRHGRGANALSVPGATLEGVHVCEQQQTRQRTRRVVARGGGSRSSVRVLLDWKSRNGHCKRL